MVLSDGQDTASRMALGQLMAQIDSTAEEDGNAPKLFTIAFGKDADTAVLKQIAEVTGGNSLKAILRPSATSTSKSRPFSRLAIQTKKSGLRLFGEVKAWFCCSCFPA